MQIEINTTCCGKEMKRLGVMNFFNMNVSEIKRWLCVECGRFIEFVVGYFDAKQLETLLKSCE